MFRRILPTILFCVIFAVSVLPCMGGDEESGGLLSGDSVLSGIGNIGDSVLSGIGNVGDSVLSGLGSAGDSVLSGLGSAGDFVSSGVSNVGETFGDFVSSGFSNIGDSLFGTPGSEASGDLVSMPDLLGASGDLTSALSSGLSGLLSSALSSSFGDLSSLGNLGDAADFPIVGPNIGYQRLLWLFSGESQINSIEAVFTGAISGISNIAGSLRESLSKFGKN